MHEELPFQTLATGYGLTEAGNVTLSLPGDSFTDVATTAGLPCEGIEIRIADDGEVLVRGYGVMQGYLDDPEATAAAFPQGRNADGGWFRSGDGGTVDRHRLDKRAAGVGDAVDAAMHVVAQGIAGIVLHVANEDVVPVDHVQGAIGSELKIHRAEVAIAALQQVLPESGLPAGAVVHDLVLLDAEESDGIAQDDISLHFVREVAGGDDLQA